MPYPRLCTLRDVGSYGVPPQALAMKSIPEKRRSIGAASELFTCRLRKRYSPPLAFEVSDLEVTSAAGSATVSGAPLKDAADVRVEIVVGGAVSGGAVTVRISREDGVATTWAATQALPADGVLLIDGVTLTLSGTFVALDTVTYTAGPSPAVRASVGVWAAWLMINNRGADPKTMELLKGAYDQAIGFAKELAKGEEAELDQKSDATPGRAEGGPTWTQHTRNGFLFGRP